MLPPTRRTSPAVTLLTTLLTTFGTAATQQFDAGYQHSLAALPSNATTPCNHQLGTVYFDGSDLWLERTGQPRTSLLTFPVPRFGAFTVPFGNDELLFGESSAGTIWWLSPGIGASSQIATLPFAYDAVDLGAGKALISARTGGFQAPDNELWVLDVATGQTTLAAIIPGASGPLACDALGDIFYADAPTTYPAPPGSVAVFRLRRGVLDASLLAQTVLGPADLELVIAGLDAAGSLACDSDGDLLFTDWMQNRIGELDDVSGAGAVAAAAHTFASYPSGGVTPGVLQFAPANTALFEPFEPGRATLLVHETDYVATSHVRRIGTKRARLQTTAAGSGMLPIPAGQLPLVTTDAAPGGVALLLVTPALRSFESPLWLPAFETPLRLDLNLMSAAGSLAFALDASGASSLSIPQPGFQPAIPALVQVAFLGSGGELGTTPALALTLTN